MQIQADTQSRWHHCGRAIDVLLDRIEHLFLGKHLRASRGFLDWSRSELSTICGLSVSTIRRLEDDDAFVSRKLLRVAMATFRAHGIIFSVTDDGILAVGRRPDSDIGGRSGVMSDGVQS